ncbi:hypothetical protein [Teichococcus aestuarii]|uniref:hypothetical protein n=1 Tax=Teichococcus aestuarii TaxID=568898 RepID=UPI00361A5A7D
MPDDAAPALRALLTATGGADPAAEVQDLLASPAFARIVAALEADHDRFVQQLIALTQIPSPPSARRRAPPPMPACCATRGWSRWRPTRRATSPRCARAPIPRPASSCSARISTRCSPRAPT